jgi:hypothetical protein
MNAYDDHNKGTHSAIQYISRDIDRLRVDKSMPDAPKEIILEAIAANEARIPTLRAKLQKSERIKEKLIEETDIIFENAIRRLGKPKEEESKEPMVPG